MKVDLGTLNAVLSELKLGLSSRGIIEQMKHFHFMDTHIVSFNDQMLIGAEFETGIFGSVDADTLSKIIGKIPNKEGEISASNDTINIKTKGFKLDLKLVSEESPIVTKIRALWDKRAETVPVPQDFVTGLKMCYQNYTKTDTYQQYSLYLNIDGADMSCLQTMQGSWYKMGNSLEDSFFIPMECAGKLAKMNITGISKGKENWKTLETAAGTVIMVVTVDIQNFPDFRKVFRSVKTEGLPLPLNADVANATSVVGVLGEGEEDVDRKITVRVDPDSSQYELIGERAEGKVHAHVPATFADDTAKFQFKINPDFLQEISTKGETLFVTTKSVQVEYNRFKYLCMISDVMEEEE